MESPNINTIYFILQPSPEFETLAKIYNEMKYCVFRWLVWKGTKFKDREEAIQNAFWRWYNVIKDVNIPYQLAINCLNDAVNLYFSYLTQSGERKPSLYPKKISINLSPYTPISIDLANMKLKLLGYEAKIVSLSKDVKQIEASEIKKAKLVKKGDKWLLKLVLKPKQIATLG